MNPYPLHPTRISFFAFLEKKIKVMCVFFFGAEFFFIHIDEILLKGFVVNNPPPHPPLWPTQY